MELTLEHREARGTSGDGVEETGFGGHDFEGEEFGLTSRNVRVEQCGPTQH
jgi:hypothetical protein